uniref:Uncharacterized protein n=1 Tax=Anguilla anguilla TaxID=7936 RepID=A0A0E9Q2Z7_ANGAN
MVTGLRLTAGAPSLRIHFCLTPHGTGTT